MSRLLARIAPGSAESFSVAMVARGSGLDWLGSFTLPRRAKQKGKHDIWQAWGGVAGIQATLPVLMTDGVHARRAVLRAGRASHRHRSRPTFRPVPAQRRDRRRSRCRPLRSWIPNGAGRSAPASSRLGAAWSAYLGREFTGRVMWTIVRGKTVFVDGQVIGQPGWGQFVRPRPAPGAP